MTNSPKTQPARPADDFVSLQDLLYLCLAHWRWFVLSLAVCLGAALWYLLTTQPVYQRTASVLIKEDASSSKSAGADVATLFSDMGFGVGKSNVQNELFAMQAPSVLLEAGRRIAYDVNYDAPGAFHRRPLYGRDLPVRVFFSGLKPEQSVSFTLNLAADGSFTLTDLENSEHRGEGRTFKGRLEEPLHTPAGRITVTRADAYKSYLKTGSALYVRRANLYNMVDAIAANLNASIAEEKATLINLTYKDAVAERAEDMINAIINVYKENWMKDKNQVTVATSNFITERLGVIEHELGDVDEKISSFKSANLLPDVEAASNIYMQKSQKTDDEILALSTQRAMAGYVKEYLDADPDLKRLLPVNSGIESPSIEKQIADYNETLLKRNMLPAGTNDSNPLVVDYNNSLRAMREAILQSIDNLIVDIDTQLAHLRRSENRTTSLITSNPGQAKYLQSVGRQQKVKEALYIFLLQKREENELSQAFTAYNTRLISPPSGKLTPVAPVRRNILLVALVLGLLVPVVILFVRENMNTRIRGRKDIESLTIPFLGEIPLYRPRRKRSIFARRSRQKSEPKRILVREGRRDVINEAFRVLRTNLEFIAPADGKAEVMLITSFNPGSGKSFLTMNIAMSLAIKKKRVLVIDGDMRHGSASAYVGSPATGLSDYLGGRIDSTDGCLVADKTQPTLTILPSGTLPPNPTELLFNPRLKDMVEHYRPLYDYIFVDCPPIEVVADTQILEHVGDRTLFVVRAGLLERVMVPELQKLYDEKKYKNMALILNGTRGGYGHYGYGYRYGYGYGYGYGYHYGSSSDDGGGNGWLIDG